MAKLIVEDVSPTTSPLHDTSFYPDLFVAMRNTKFNQSVSGLVDVRKEVGEQLKDVVPVSVIPCQMRSCFPLTPSDCFLKLGTVVERVKKLTYADFYVHR